MADDRPGAAHGKIKAGSLVSVERLKAEAIAGPVLFPIGTS